MIARDIDRFERLSSAPAIDDVLSHIDVHVEFVPFVFAPLRAPWALKRRSGGHDEHEPDAALGSMVSHCRAPAEYTRG